MHVTDTVQTPHHTFSARPPGINTPRPPTSSVVGLAKSSPHQKSIVSKMQFSAVVLALASVAFSQVVSQISDGQIQATTSTVAAVSTAAVVSQIGDGQIQATTATVEAQSTAAVVSQISDGQIQATTATVEVQTGAAAQVKVAGAAAVAAAFLMI